MNRFQPFLVIDPQRDDAPGSRDPEEVSLEVRRRAGGLGGGPSVRVCACVCAFCVCVCVDRGRVVETDSTIKANRTELTNNQVLRVPLDEFRALLVGGDMLLPSVATGFLALERLREEGLI